jgi:hypothetical protein
MLLELLRQAQMQPTKLRIRQIVSRQTLRQILFKDDPTPPEINQLFLALNQNQLIALLFSTAVWPLLAVIELNIFLAHASTKNPYINS